MGGDKRAREEQQPANKPDGTDHANRVDHMTQHKIRKRRRRRWRWRVGLFNTLERAQRGVDGVVKRKKKKKKRNIARAPTSLPFQDEDYFSLRIRCLLKCTAYLSKLFSTASSSSHNISSQLPLDHKQFKLFFFSLLNRAMLQHS